MRSTACMPIFMPWDKATVNLPVHSELFGLDFGSSLM
jgi:hypothetical protein